jgi:SAM-dependent methyltransferase
MSNQPFTNLPPHPQVGASAYTCRACFGRGLVEVIDFGPQPIAHRLLDSPEESELRHPLALHRCSACGLLQIRDPIPSTVLYLDDEQAFSSWKPEPHMADEICSLITHANMLQSILEIGCNEGVFLEQLRHCGVPRLVGLEPNRHTGGRARERGFPIHAALLNPAICEEILRHHGQFDAIVARQVIEHVSDLRGFFDCVDTLLAEDGVLFLDHPDVAVALAMGDCSVIWEEHVNYFTRATMERLLDSYGYRVLDAKRYDFSGGTLAIVAKRGNSGLMAGRGTTGRSDATLYGQAIRAYGHRLREMLATRRAAGDTVVLYGVGCRGSTAVNTLDLAELIDFAVDDQDARQGKFMPGSRLEIRSPETLRGADGAVLCLLAVNHENEQRVKAKLGTDHHARTRTISLCSPTPIWEELRSLTEGPR